MQYQQLDDLKKIKKEYGEKMEHLCSSFFPTILEKPGLLYHIISSHFIKSKSLYYDIVNEKKEFLFKEYIYNFFDIERIKEEKSSKKVKELLEEAGYDLFECKTNEDIQKFRKYYKPDEELCTFRDLNRINNHYIFFIVKKNVDEIRREDFNNKERREDEYGVSVLDLQFDKGKRQRVSIKSRYNHKVINPDATYSNNLDAIIPGLIAAFEMEYGFNIDSSYKIGFELNDYVEAIDGKFYKYNYEINNIHYCPNNIIIDNGNVINDYADKNSYTFMDYFILDEKEKKIIIYDNKIKDSFVEGLINIKKIEIENKEENKTIKLTLEENKTAEIKLDSSGRIIEYTNNNLLNCDDDFLSYNKNLKKLNLINLEKCGNNFLYKNRNLQELKLPNLRKCGDCFLYYNEQLNEVNLPKLEKCGGYFLVQNMGLQELKLPNLIQCKDHFLYYNNKVFKINLPNLKNCDDCFFSYNKNIQELTLPNLIECGDDFLSCNNNLKELNLPKLEKCKDHFLVQNMELQELNLPNLRKCGNNFLYWNNNLQELNLPNLIECGDDFLSWNNNLKKLNLPNLSKEYYGNLKSNFKVVIDNNNKLTYEENIIGSKKNVKINNSRK